ncbi:MAG: hypothetical protein L3K13_07470 [Thermoplasmata archaeon]|nr:hypothetical protein [Thermoplasmata archaeon]
MEFAEPVRGGLGSVLVWGSDRTVAALCAFAVARSSPARLIWLDIRAPDGATDEYRPVLERLVPAESRYVTRRESEMGPQDASANSALSTVIRPDEPEEVVANLFEFLRLPRLVQEIAARFASPQEPLVLFCTSVDRIVHLYPEDTEATRRFHLTSQEQSVKIVSSFSGPERKDRFAFDHVFRIAPGPAQRWRSWSILSERENLPPASTGAMATPIESDGSILGVLRESGLLR